MTHYLPDGHRARSDKAYVDAWRSLCADLATALGGEPSGNGYDPIVTVRVGGCNVDFPASAALAILKHLERT